jgi:hypothetical protein
VEINLADPARQVRQQAEHAVLDHPAAPGDAEDLVVVCEPGAVEPPPQ